MAEAYTHFNSAADLRAINRVRMLHARTYMGKFNVVFYVAQYVFSSTETEWPKDILKIHRKSYLFY
jgi:hypothetical protein